jgi:hypothetical protein
VLVPDIVISMFTALQFQKRHSSFHGSVTFTETYQIIGSPWTRLTSRKDSTLRWLYPPEFQCEEGGDDRS